MFAPLLLVLAVILLLPLAPANTWTGQPDGAFAPLVIEASNVPVEGPNGQEITGATKLVVARTAARLVSMGIPVEPEGQSRFVAGTRTVATSPLQANLSPGVEPVILTVAFNAASSPHASGTETRFGGQEAGAWRLASRVQSHLVSGLRDVLAYDSYDRGVTEYVLPVVGPGMEAEPPAWDPWVTAYPLFATNPAERELLRWTETLDLISAALANAIGDYLDPAQATPDKVVAGGWRPSPRRQPVSPRVITRAQDEALVALTFDGGSSSIPTPAILVALREAGVRATMFMTAGFVQRNPGLVIQMARDGHEFGNHTATHPDVTKLADEQITAELESLDEAVLELTGRSTRPWFRPPFGAYDRRVVEVAAWHGYYTLLWTEDSADWRPEMSPSALQDRLLSRASPGSILIQHLGSPQSAQVMAPTLAGLKARGIEFGTLSEVIGSID